MRHARLSAASAGVAPAGARIVLRSEAREARPERFARYADPQSHERGRLRFAVACERRGIEIGTPVVEERFHVEANDRHRERRGGIGVQQKQMDLLDAQSADRQIQHRLVSRVETRVAGVEARIPRATCPVSPVRGFAIAHRERLAPESSGTRAFRRRPRARATRNARRVRRDRRER